MRKFLFIASVVMFLTGISNAYYYYLGPFEVYESSRVAPAGTKGLIDLSCRDIPNVAFIASEIELGSGYTSFGEGDIQTIDVNLADRIRWLNIMGYLPRGQRLSDLLWDQLTDGSDAMGITAPKPLIPTSKGKLNLRLGKHPIVRSENFTWGDFHTNKIKARILIDLWKARQAALDGKMVDPITRQVDRDYHRRILQAYCEKYKVVWTEIRPDNWPLSESPLNHNTTITDTFPTAACSAFEGDLTWTELLGDWVCDGAGWIKYQSNPKNYIRADSDLSSDDMYIQTGIYASASNQGYLLRKDDSSTRTFYFAGDTAPTQSYIKKSVASTETALTSDGGTLDYSKTHKFEADGSDLTYYEDGAEFLSVTDTSITGNTRAGLCGFSYGGWLRKDFEAGDLGGAPPATVEHQRRRVVVAQ